MIVSIRLGLWLVRLTVLLSVSVGCWALGRFGYAQYLIGTLNDQGAKADLDTLAQAVQRYPHSARIQAQWAAATLTQASDFEDSLALAEVAAQQAVQLSPNNADFYLLLAATQSVSGDTVAREAHLRRAVALAPRYPTVRWQLANLLVRVGKLEESLDEFRQVAEAKPSLLPTAFDLLWEASNGDFNVLARATGEQPRNLLTLANFLLQQNRPEEAVQIFSRMEMGAGASVEGAGDFLNRLITAGQPELARRLWGEMRFGGMNQADEVSSLISNGNFEAEAPLRLTHFDWQLKRSDYASPKIEDGAARTGQRALRVDFAGRDTTRLTDEVRQLLVLQPATAYRLVCHAKTAQFRAPEGPRWVILSQTANQLIATTDKVNPDQTEWQLLTADFVTPAQGKLFWLALQRTPQFSYDEPTKGTLWFDDCTLQSLHNTSH